MSNPFKRDAPPPPMDAELLAMALRAHNCRYNRTLEPWDEIPERWREMWREKARWVIAHMGREMEGAK